MIRPLPETCFFFSKHHPNLFAVPNKSKLSIQPNQSNCIYMPWLRSFMLCNKIYLVFQRLCDQLVTNTKLTIVPKQRVIFKGSQRTPFLISYLAIRVFETCRVETAINHFTSCSLWEQLPWKPTGSWFHPIIFLHRIAC